MCLYVCACVPVKRPLYTDRKGWGRQPFERDYRFKMDRIKLLSTQERTAKDSSVSFHTSLRKSGVRVGLDDKRK